MRTLLLILTMCLFVLPAQAKYSGGSGTAKDPYQIATAADLIALGETPTDCDKHFILTADIDLDPKLAGGKVFDKAVIAPDTDPSPNKYGYNPYDGTPFTGVVDGKGHTISHLTVKGKDYLGLFGLLAPPAEVRNLGVVDANIVGSGSGVAGLVGVNTWPPGHRQEFHKGGAVTGCYSTGTISGNSSVGGLVGSNDGSVTQCHSSGIVSGLDIVGGLVGVNGNTGWPGGGGVVAQCYSTVAVSGSSFVGGLVGVNNGGPGWSAVTQSCSTGVVSGSSSVGGLVGANGGRVAECYSTGAVRGTDYVGGLVGSMGTVDDGSSVTECYSAGRVSGTGKWVGGLVGGLEGMDDGVAHSFWDIQTSGQTTSSGGIGKTTAEMQMASTFIDWGLCNEGWTTNDGADYPRLRWENEPGKRIAARLSDFVTGQGTETSPYLIYTLKDLDLIARFPCEHDKHFRLGFLNGEGTQENPYLVCTADELNLVGMCPYERDAHFRLMADIDLSAFDGRQGRPAFNAMASFGGVFDGSGHTISHLTISLFGQLTSGAEVKELEVVDVNIAGPGNNIGGLVGASYGSVTQCHSGGVVSGLGSVGGLVGWNRGSVTRCSSMGAVNGNSGHVGGLVGTNYGIVIQCYSTGAVRGKDRVGGLVGSNSGTVTQCYSTGTAKGTGSVGGLVGDMGWTTASFWDIQTSGQATSAGGTGMTTAEMQTAKTFLDAGWDFVGETKNGTEDIWWILEGKDYPRLWWELPPGR